MIFNIVDLVLSEIWGTVQPLSTNYMTPLAIPDERDACPGLFPLHQVVTLLDPNPTIGELGRSHDFSSKQMDMLGAVVGKPHGDLI